MRRLVLKFVAGLFLACIATGCGGKPEQAEIPKDLNQSLPKVAAPVGGGDVPNKAKLKGDLPGSVAQ